jgi:glutamate/aspartate transport system substrate-binding protein
MRLVLFAMVMAVFSPGGVNAQTGDTFAKAKTTGVITMGVRKSSGLSFEVAGGSYVGYHVDVCQFIVANLARAVGRELTVKYQPVNSQNRIPLVQNGTVDLECGSTTNNEARQKEVAFAITTFVEEVRMAVRADSDISAIAQLNGKKVATTTGTTAVQTLRKNERVIGVTFKEVFGKDHADSFRLMASGKADAFVMDSSILASNIAHSDNPAGFKIVGEVLSVEPIAVMMRKDDVALKKLADDTIKVLIKSGELEKIYYKWMMQPVPPENWRVGLPVNDSTRAAWQMPNDKPMEAYAAK